MKVVKKLFFTLSFIMPALLLAQSSYLTLGGKEEWLLNRMEIKTNANGLSFSSLKPFNRKYITNTADYWDSLYTAGNKNATVLTSTDKYNLQRFLMANSEWS
ncbi:MAG TPA: hypothetical protein PKZ66_05725, partial [Chitinophagaceae bacterium]|nr:hypothetical protein [Chitinophagaceae bacterium]